MTEEPTDVPADEPAEDDDEPGAARALTLHVLRMMETRMDAAAIALQSEIQLFSSRLQLRLLAAATFFLALWGGIVLLAIALPPHLRIPVLAAVVAAFVIAGVWAIIAGNRAVSSRDVGSMSWFLENLKQDVDVLTRSLAHSRQQRQAPPPAPPAAANEPTRSDPNDLAA
ncbi:MAG TPA: hypothetical protein VFU13_10495 [Steroidobacteraceae bacterium]|nr:hypothetical protein [Steroidobacteraceae bacterium]